MEFEDNTSGDGLIRAMTADGSSVDTVLSNVGGHTYQDPYYGFIWDNYLYYADRSTGVVRIPLTTRNAQWNIKDYPYYFQSCIGIVEELWYWGKTFNGAGIWRFTDSDILPDTESYMTAEKPKAGGILNSSYCNLFPKSFVYDFIRHLFYFSLYDDATGVYKIAMDDIEKLQNINNINDLKPYLLDADVQINPITEYDKGEGSVGEYIGICQMTFDMVRGDVYFGYRSANPEETGLYRYDATLKK